MNPARRLEYLKAIGIEPWVRRLASGAAGESGWVASAEDTAIPQPTAGAVEASASRAQKGRRRPVDPGWVSETRIIIGPGNGHTLLLCGSADEAATEMAADIARSLEGEPVWGWPVADGSATGLSLEQAIGERLFTRVLIFGSALAKPAGDATSQVAGSAHLVWADPIPALMKSGAARQRLWSALSTRLWCMVRA